jgi:hypothetical protein
MDRIMKFQGQYSVFKKNVLRLMKLQKNMVTQFYAFLRSIASSMIFNFPKFGHETLQFLRKGIDQITPQN